MAGARALYGRQNDLPHLRVASRIRCAGARSADRAACGGRSLPRTDFARPRLSTDDTLDRSLKRAFRPPPQTRGQAEVFDRETRQVHWFTCPTLAAAMAG